MNIEKLVNYIQKMEKRQEENSAIYLQGFNDACQKLIKALQKNNAEADPEGKVQDQSELTPREEALQQQVLELYKDGYTYGAIQKLLHISPDMVIKYIPDDLKRGKGFCSGKKDARERNKEALELYRQGKSEQEIIRLTKTTTWLSKITPADHNERENNLLGV